MKIIKLLLQSVAAAAVAAVPLLAEAQPYPQPAGAAPTGPYASGYPYASTVYPMAYPSEAWHRAVAGTPFDPLATTVRVVPPKGGTVMLYRNGGVRGWWMHPSAITVRPGQVYGLVATRGTQVLFNAAMVFRPGYTDVVWTTEQVPRIAYSPAWNYNPYAYAYGSGYGYDHGYDDVYGRRSPAHASHPYGTRSGAVRPTSGQTDTGQPTAGVEQRAQTAAASPSAMSKRLRAVMARRSSGQADKASLKRTAARRTPAAPARASATRSVTKRSAAPATRTTTKRAVHRQPLRGPAKLSPKKAAAPRFVPPRAKPSKASKRDVKRTKQTRSSSTARAGLLNKLRVARATPQD